jgi:hypothetical protein
LKNRRPWRFFRSGLDVQIPAKALDTAASKRQQEATMKKYLKHTAVLFAGIIALITGCASTSGKGGVPTKINELTVVTWTTGPYETVDLRATRSEDMPEETIAGVYENLSKNLKDGLRIALIPVYPSPELDKPTADYTTEQLYIRFINSSRYQMVDRADIDKAIAEQQFQTEYVNNDNAVQIGKLLGAQAVVIGTVEGKGVNRRIVMRALEVNSGRILAMLMEYIPVPGMEGFSEIVVLAEDYTTIWLMGNNMITERILVDSGEEVLFRVPNGRWEVWIYHHPALMHRYDKPDYSTLSLNHTRLFLNIAKAGTERTITGTKRESESIAVAAQESGSLAVDRIANAQAAAQKLAKELEGKIRPRAGTAFFPLTVNGISADTGNFLFDAMSMELANNGGLQLIEKQKLLALLNEYDFQMSGMVGYRTIGQLLGADVVIFGIGRENEIVLAAVDVARFSILAQVSHKF